MSYACLILQHFVSCTDFFVLNESCGMFIFICLFLVLFNDASVSQIVQWQIIGCL
jgi:hypothetical protein